LRDAALLHLDLHIDALRRHDITLSDASAYNIQFHGCRPVFIDVLSFQPYRDGDYWRAHQQFCEHFLYPLLLTAWFNVPFNSWLRGSLAGVRAIDFARLVPLRRKASLRVWTHVLAPARLAPRSDRTRVAETMRGRPLPKAAFLYLLEQLRGWIGGLTCDVTTAWQRYETDCSYSQASSDQKERFVEQAVARCRPARLLDLGCNQGAYSFLALGAGAERVIGLDSDFGVVERAYAEGARRQVAFTPLCVSLTDPSPAQGWNLAERTGLFDRLAGDMCLALALVHHLAVAENVPLPALVRWLVGVAPRGVVEFVGKEDPMVREMLAVRSDIFPDYRLETFLELLGSEARVVRHEPIAQRDRHLIEYDV
jgi:ribosomal protein L11 methylase PrmA